MIAYGKDYTDEHGEPLYTILDQLHEALIDTTRLDSIPIPDPIIKNVLFSDSLAWLQGKSGDGKTFVALDIAGCVGTGNDWQGHPTEQGQVLYLIAEGVSGITQRVRAWEESMGTLMFNVQFLPVAVQVNGPGQWTALIELAAAMTADLIVIDTQARVTVGMEENSAKDMGEFVQRLEQLRNATGACVLVVHHQGRNGDHMRGSTALYGSASTELQVSRDELDITVKCGKQKDAEPIDDIHLRMVPTLGSLVLVRDDDVLGRRPGTSAGARKMASRWWQTFRDDWVSKTTLKNAEIAASERSLHRYVRTLTDEALVTKEDVGRNPRYRLTRNPDPGANR